MQKEKIYAFKCDDQFVFFNGHDLNSFDRNTLEWLGGGWLVRDDCYIIANYYQILGNKYYSPMSENEYKDAVQKLAKIDIEFANYLNNCELCNGEPIEKLLNKKTKKIVIDDHFDIDDISYVNAEFWPYNMDGEPITVTYRELENCDRDYSCYYGKYMMIY